MRSETVGPASDEDSFAMECQGAVGLGEIDWRGLLDCFGYGPR